MTVIAADTIDPGDETIRWEVPTDVILNNTPIPRGMRTYTGAGAVAALGANDETSVDITFTFPTAFNYLPRLLNISFVSDDLTTEFSNFGTLQYLGSLTNLHPLLCDGAAFRAAVRSVQTFYPTGNWRRWINGPDGDVVDLFLADISGDTSTAGDVVWYAEFLEYDIEQCQKWPVNTPVPVFTN